MNDLSQQPREAPFRTETRTPRKDVSATEERGDFVLLPCYVLGFPGYAEEDNPSTLGSLSRDLLSFLKACGADQVGP